MQSCNSFLAVNNNKKTINCVIFFCIKCEYKKKSVKACNIFCSKRKYKKRTIA